MIRNRLAELLAERKLKISRVANDLPNLSRNTITSVTKNSTKMIQIETVDSLCQYLDVSPNDFFEFIPFDIKTNSLIDDDFKASSDGIYNDMVCMENLSFSTYLSKSSANISINSQTFDLSITPTNKYIFIPLIDKTMPISQRSLTNSGMFSTTLNILLGHYDDKETYDNQIDDFKKLWFKDLSAGFRSNIEDEIKTQVLNFIFEEVGKVTENNINVHNMSIDFSFSFNDANDFKLSDNTETKNANFNTLNDDGLPF